MKKNVLLALLLCSCLIMSAQISAVTESGYGVVLFEDGTWKYLNDNLKEGAKIDVNKKIFVRDQRSTLFVKSEVANVGVWLNPDMWSFSKAGGRVEFQFEKNGGEVYGIMISERKNIPAKALRMAAISNARDAAPDIRVIKEEYRRVNGIQVLMMQMAGTVDGVKFMYYGYYYSNSKGSVQLITYTGENLFDRNYSDMEFFLNGLVKTN